MLMKPYLPAYEQLLSCSLRGCGYASWCEYEDSEEVKSKQRNINAAEHAAPAGG
jgi:hypothetical protein